MSIGDKEKTRLAPCNYYPVCVCVKRELRRRGWICIRGIGRLELDIDNMSALIIRSAEERKCVSPCSNHF